MAPIQNYSQSKVKHFRRCQKQFAFRYDYPLMLKGEDGAGQELVPKQKKLPLYRGSWMHALQESLHYQWAGFDKFIIRFGEGNQKLIIESSSWKKTHEHLTIAFEGLFDEERDELGDLPSECERMFKAYIRRWKEDREIYEVATINDQPGIEVVVDQRLGRYARFKGRIDLVVKDLEYGGLWIWDAKWVGKIPHPDERMMSPQSILYVWALRKMGYDIRGFVYNYGRTKPPTWPETLKRGSLTLRRNLDTDRATYIKAIKELHGKDWKKWIPHYKHRLDELKGRDELWFRRERIPVEKPRIEQALREFAVSIEDIQNRATHDVAPRSYFYNCKFGCDYHDLCVSEFQGLDIAPLIKSNFMLVGERYGEEDLLKD